MTRLVSLLTDFGLADTYVGQVKAAVLGAAPSARLIDLTHAVPAQDVRAGAFLLWAAVEVFPPDAVHLAVVDPGVGGPRRAVAARAARGDLFVGPDNGLLPPALDRLGGPAAAVELADPRYWRPGPSATFHGRDIFGPAAGHLAAGLPLERLGPPVALGRPFALPTPRAAPGGLLGEVLHVDGFGNLVTNLPAPLLPPRFQLRVARRAIRDAPQPHYQAVPPGQLLALVGSAGLLEVAARDASAAATLGVGRGAAVAVEPA